MSQITDDRLEKIAAHVEEWGETMQSQTTDILSALRELQTLRAIPATAQGPAESHQLAEERLCECGAAGSGEGHSDFCPWLTSAWKTWGDAFDAYPAEGDNGFSALAARIWVDGVRAAAALFDPCDVDEALTELERLQNEGRRQSILSLITLKTGIKL